MQQLQCLEDMRTGKLVAYIHRKEESKKLRSTIYQFKVWSENQNASVALFKEIFISCIQKSVLIIRPKI